MSAGCMDLFPSYLCNGYSKTVLFLYHRFPIVVSGKKSSLFRELTCELKLYTIFLMKIPTNSCQLQRVKRTTSRTYGF